MNIGVIVPRLFFPFVVLRQMLQDQPKNGCKDAVVVKKAVVSMSLSALSDLSNQLVFSS